MDSLSWLQVCGEGQTEGCIPTVQVIYLIAVVVGVVLVAIIGRRSRDLETSTLSLMPVAIAINIAVGAIAVALRVPIYLDSIAVDDRYGQDHQGEQHRPGRPAVNYVEALLRELALLGALLNRQDRPHGPHARRLRVRSSA